MMVISKLSLEESIRNYDRENDRKKDLESKASYFLGIIAIFSAIWTNLISYIMSNHVITIFFIVIVILTGLILIFTVLCAYFALEVLKVRIHAHPVSDPDLNVLKTELIEEEKILKENLFYSYLTSFSYNYKKNNLKAIYLKESEKYLLYIIILSVMSLFFILVII